MKTQHENDNGQDFQQITEILQDYFDGLYEADVDKIRDVFHLDTVLKANGLRKTRDEWLDAVASRPVPKEHDFNYDFNVISIEIINDQAMVKANVPLMAGHYIDYLGCLKKRVAG